MVGVIMAISSVVNNMIVSLYIAYLFMGLLWKDEQEGCVPIQFILQGVLIFITLLSDTKLSNSRAAHLAISSSETRASVDIINCRPGLNDLIETHKEVAQQWVPAHCGLQGNKTADSSAKKATKITQISDKPIAFSTAG